MSETTARILGIAFLACFAAARVAVLLHYDRKRRQLLRERAERIPPLRVTALFYEEGKLTWVVAPWLLLCVAGVWSVASDVIDNNGALRTASDVVWLVFAATVYLNVERRR